MKFGKSLSNQIEETLPEWRDKFLSYKDLKKKLKLVEPKTAGAASAGDRPSKRPRVETSYSSSSGSGDGDKENMSEEEIDFILLLEDELEKFNTFFVEKEEEYIIRLKVNFFLIVNFFKKNLLIYVCIYIYMYMFVHLDILMEELRSVWLLRKFSKSIK